MFTFFGSGKCPLCGTTGKKLEENVFFCNSCDIPFNDYGLSSLDRPKNMEKNVVWT